DQRGKIDAEQPLMAGWVEVDPACRPVFRPDTLGVTRGLGHVHHRRVKVAIGKGGLRHGSALDNGGGSIAPARWPVCAGIAWIRTRACRTRPGRKAPSGESPVRPSDMRPTSAQAWADGRVAFAELRSKNKAARWRLWGLQHADSQLVPVRGL